MISRPVNKNQFSKQPSIKTQILLTHTSSTLDDYFTKISTRWNGSYDASFTFTIGKDGAVYCHFNPLHYSNVFGIPEIDRQIISIGLENEGWLKRNERDGVFFDWKGSIYNGQVYSKQWRGNNLWAAYEEPQIESMLRLIGTLVKEFNITPVFSGDNLPLENAQEFQGVLNRSNYFRCYYDLSPAADFEHISNEIKKMN